MILLTNVWYIPYIDSAVCGGKSWALWLTALINEDCELHQVMKFIRGNLDWIFFVQMIPSSIQYPMIIYDS